MTDTKFIPSSEGTTYECFIRIASERKRNKFHYFISFTMTNKNSKFVGLALAAVLLPVVASAATIEELQAQINALMAQLAAAKPATTASCSVVLSKSLKAGMSDAEVMDLQKALNSDVDTQVAASGVGSKGNETMYFGPATKAAVIKFQNKYASEVLAPAGLSAGTGFVGASTRAKINALCSGAVVSTPSTTPTTTPAPVTGLNGTAGSVTVTSYTSDNDTNVVTGVAQTVAGFKVKADGSDVAVSHLKVSLAFEASNASAYPNASNYLNRYFDRIDVYANGSKVASANASDFNRDSAGQYSKTIALDNKVIVKMGASNQTTFTIKAVGASSIDSDNAGAKWDITEGNIRFADATGAVLSDTTTYTINGVAVNKLSTSSDVKVRFSAGAANPDVKTNFVSDTSSGDKVVMNEFKVKAEGTKVSFDQLQMNVTTSTTTSNMISELQLVQNGSVIDTVDTSSSELSAGVAYFNIDNLVTVNQDETQTFQVVAKMQKIGTATFVAGQTATISFKSINAQDVNGDVIPSSKFYGSADGRQQTFLATGLNVTKVSSNVAATTNSNTPSASFGTFTYDVKVTASGNDVWVPFTASSTGAAGVRFTVEDSNNTDVTAAGTNTASVALISGGTRDGNTVKIADGESATLEVVVTYDPSAAGQYRLQIGSVGYNNTDAATGASLSITAAPESDFQSSNLFITN